MDTAEYRTMWELLDLDVEDLEFSVDPTKHLSSSKIWIKTLRDLILTLDLDVENLRERGLYPSKPLTKKDVYELQEFQEMHLDQYFLSIWMLEIDVKNVKYLFE